MFPLNLPRIFPTIFCDSDQSPPAPASRAAAAINTVKSAMAVPESELKRWRRTFDANAQTVVGDQKYVRLVLLIFSYSKRHVLTSHRAFPADTSTASSS